MLIIYSIKCGGFPTSVAFELFDKMVLPVLTYGAEIWGSKQYKAIEDIQIYYCKKVLGLPMQTHNSATLGECGRFPVHIYCAKKCIKYWLKILNMPSHRYVKCCYVMLKRLDEQGNKTWATGIKDLLFKYGFGTVWLEQGVVDEGLFISLFMTRLKDCYKQEWNSEVHNSSKLSVYCTFKSMLEPEKYLEYINVWKFKQALAKFRCSAHKLAIERGRHNGTLLENRLCSYCESIGTIVIEDEYHVLLCCPRFTDLRNMYIDPIYITNVTFDKFITIMSSIDCYTLRRPGVP